MKKLISAIPSLKPTQVFDSKTGEELSLTDADTILQNLLSYVQSETSFLYENSKAMLLELLKSYNKLSPAEFARQNGVKIRKNLPSAVKAQSRVEKLVQHKLISEVASYVSNPNLDKQEPSFSQTLNLGAVDKQMVTMSVDKTELSLLWKVWDKELLFLFTLPEYILTRNIKKYSLPTVRYSKKGIVFSFTIEENIPTKKHNTTTAGIDLGRTKPYVVAVTNQQGNRVAHYESSKRLTQLNNKRQRLLTERKNILIKIRAYTELGLNTEILKTEANRKRNKITRLGKTLAQQTGNEISKKLEKHNLHLVKVENLKWVTGAKYGSKWNHSKQQDAIQHALLRKGTKTVTVNPKNTSQHCHNCTTKIVHNTKNRTVRCDTCQSILDRDFNAAMNIAKQPYPVLKRKNGDNCSSVNTEQVIEPTVHKSLVMGMKNSHLIRKTT